MAPDLGLDLKLSASRIVTNLSKEGSSSIADDDGKRIAKLEEYVRNLEDERGKIEVFKRELPLCMFLLNDVIGGMKDELEQCRSEKRHVLEEFMPIKSKLLEDGGVKLEKDCKDKMNWMSSAQLWSDNYSDDNNKDCKKNIESGDESDHRRESGTPSFESNSRSLGGPFKPFKGISAISCSSRMEDKVTGGLPDLSLVSHPHVSAAAPEDHRSATVGGSASKPITRCRVSPPVSSHVTLQSQQQAARKARRCWSPELHRRFVVALQQLGGAQVATPRQIRELMKVDGLTNDEVKSHLQKYRLHTRRVPNSSSSSLNRPMVVMGGLWVPQAQEHSQSGSPQGPLQLSVSSRAISAAAGDSCEEDGKSESYSWK